MKTREELLEIARVIRANISTNLGIVSILRNLESDARADLERRVKELEAELGRIAHEHNHSLETVVQLGKERDQLRTQLAAWHGQFGTQQLSHAVAERDTLKHQLAAARETADNLLVQRDRYRNQLGTANRDHADEKALLAAALGREEQVTTQLAAAQAACRVKDDALRLALTAGDADLSPKQFNLLNRAITTTPTTALEPVVSALMAARKRALETDCGSTAVLIDKALVLLGIK